MNTIRRILAVWVCKLAIFGSKLLGKKGSSKPGQLALLVYPGILRELAASVRREILVVCGTNGKTTTNNLLDSLLRAQGYRVVCNRVGANMLYGVCCAFVDSANLWGKLDADFACLEVDEASAVKVFAHVTPSRILITNLFRDQLDRYGEIDITIDYLRRALAMAPDAQLILNGDDPLVAQFGYHSAHDCVYVGVDQDVGIHLQETKEGRFCAICGAPLAYDYYHYSQLGSYRCTGCDFARPALSFRADHVDMADGLRFHLTYPGGGMDISVSYRGFYNIYNILLSFAGSFLATGDTGRVLTVLSTYQPQIGRMETFTIRGTEVILNLSKNPAGFNQAISTVLADPREKDLLVAINDNAQDGRDISWIWDVDFERLTEGNIRHYVATGIRVDDLAVRFHYAGIGGVRKVRSLRQAAEEAIAKPTKVCYFLVNYTANFPMQDILKDLQKTQ